MRPNPLVWTILTVLGILVLGFTLQDIVRRTTQLDIAQKCYNFDNKNSFCSEILKDD